MTMNRSRLALPMSAALLAFAVEVRAQEQEPSGRSATDTLNLVSTLGFPEVQEELALRPEQLAEVNELRQDQYAAITAKTRPIQGLPPAEMSEQLNSIWRELSDELDDRLSEILDPEQSTRLEQILLQMKGFSAFFEPEVRNLLGLGDEQKLRLVAIQKAYQEEGRAILEAHPDDRGAATSEIVEAREKADAEALSMLTADQREAWSALVGREFKRPVPSSVARRPSTR